MIYETRIGKLLKKQAEESIEEVQKLEAINSDTIFRTDGCISLSSVGTDSIRPWDFPFLKDGKLYVDLRPFTSRTGSKTNVPEYNALVLMAKIEKAWHESRNILANSAPAVCTVYSRWLAGLITQRFNMPPIMNSNLQILFAFFYLTRFYDKDQLTFDREQIGAFELKLVRITGFSADVIRATFSEIDFENMLDRLKRNDESSTPDLTIFCESVKPMIQEYIPNFSADLVITLVTSGSWIGYKQAQRTAVALEYPPVFMYMLATSWYSSFYQRCRIGTTAIGVKPALREEFTSVLRRLSMNQ